MCNNENAPDLRMNCEMNRVFCVRVEAFKTCEAVSILENIPEEGITRLPPVKPKACQAFLYLNDDESKNGMLGSCSLRDSIISYRMYKSYMGPLQHK